MLAPSADDSLIGNLLADKYRVLHEIGRGGMGVVYEAEHIGLGKRVAIKLMLEKYANDTEAVRRFQREALAASRIGNPHIIDVSDIGVSPDGRSFVVMELLTGAPLSTVVELAGQMPAWRAVQIMRQVLRAVGAAHAKGIVHRDLKPDNIFLVNQDDQHDFVKLLDFGISKMVDPDLQVAATRLTTTGVVIGTPLYMAPEQALGNEVTPQADIYACGVILYELLAGKPPFDGATYAVLISKLLTQEAPDLATVRTGLPVALVQAVHRALDKEPTHRFATAEMFAASLPGDRSPSMIELAGTLDSGMAIPAVSPPVRAKPWPWIAVGAALLVGVATAAVFFVLRKDGTGEPSSTAKPVAAVHDLPAPAPAPTTGMLEVKSNPPGATVVIDKTPMGVTPLLVTLDKGAHHLHVELAGHTTLDEDEEVRAGERSSVVIALPEIPAAAIGGTKPAIKPTSVKTTSKTVPHPPTISGSSNNPVIKDDPAPPPIPIKHDDPPTVKPGPATSGTKPNPY